MKSIKEWCEYMADYTIRKGFYTGWSNIPEKLMLVVTELAEAMEAYRYISSKSILVLNNLKKVGFSKVDRYFRRCKDKNQIKYIENFKEEIADVVVRVFDICGSLNIDLEKELEKKMKYNWKRPYKHGKEM